MQEVVDIDIKNKIYEIRGKQVMLDSDLANLYHVETKRINEAVKNNPNKFPERYLFRLKERDYMFLKSKFSTSKGGSRKGHTAFTEQGVAMLATILKSKVAIETSIQIMDAFVAMRHYIGDSEYRISNLEMKSIEHDNSIKLLQESFNKFEEKKKINEIYFEGQIYDASGIPLSGRNNINNSGFTGSFSCYTCTSMSYDDGSDHSISNIVNIPFPDAKYYDLYSHKSAYIRSHLGDAVYELGDFYRWTNANGSSVPYSSWNSDVGYVVYAGEPWVMRGGESYTGTGSGIFAMENNPGSANNSTSFRSVLR